MTTVLDMRGIQKRFGPVTALDNVDFAVEHGEIHALLGVNGAGKSTLIKILSGLYQADDGQIEIAGQPVSLQSPADAIRAGIASVQQHPELVGDLTGYENIFLGNEARRPGLFRRVEHGAMRAKAQELLKRLPVPIDLDVKVQDLASVEKEIIAVLHALKQENVKVLILDEPTSTLTRVEKEQLFKMMRVLKDVGVAIIYITHRLEEVFEIADRFTVFRGGRNIATMTSEDARQGDVSIPQLMLDDEMGALFPPKATEPAGDVFLSVEGLSLTNAFQDISFEVHKNEIIGFYGLVGSGIDELGKVLFGALRPTAGEIRLKGTPHAFASPADALKAGIFLVPGDRRTEGLVLADDVTFNTTLANHDRASVFGVRRFRQAFRDARDLSGKVDLSPPTLNRPAQAFSGGNQQKIVIAKGLYSQSDIYIFVEPTVGVDVGARATIYRQMRALSKDAAVIVMSSDCDEVFGVADRVTSLYRGRMTQPLSRDITRDEVLSAGLMGTAA
ncbi:sugar ABC transporter ATP-binding protein [uncultured Tateyamaria sp.]|uniref:sugar ABC transporter ATP-binding protein n=1 Tax=uncultured Tateyamaria sp. TaxID=455651 RepID=UPI0026119091|nr:sugar ABC transporter ATP-binding protein [uncultured Tateyamaria sp.]